MNAETLTALHAKAVEAVCRNAKDSFLTPEEEAFLRSVGLTRQVLWDFAEDFCSAGEPKRETFLAVAKIREEYFLHVQLGRWQKDFVPEAQLPLRDDQLDGIRWLPRIRTKARCFLEGTLDPDVMFGCGGDRAFLRRHGLTLEGFLEVVRTREAGILDYVRG